MKDLVQNSSSSINKIAIHVYFLFAALLDIWLSSREESVTCWTFDNSNPAVRSRAVINIAGLPCTPALSLAINVAGAAAVAPVSWQRIRSWLWRQAFSEWDHCIAGWPQVDVNKSRTLCQSTFRFSDQMDGSTKDLYKLLVSLHCRA